MCFGTLHVGSRRQVRMWHQKLRTGQRVSTVSLARSNDTAHGKRFVA